MADANKNTGEALSATRGFCLRDLSKAVGGAELGAQAARNVGEGVLRQAQYERTGIVDVTELLQREGARFLQLVSL